MAAVGMLFVLGSFFYLVWFLICWIATDISVRKEDGEW